jgi:NAD(P)-dependent dehydrogenase (short-subunit alcohol dehydrogenase family)
MPDQRVVLITGASSGVGQATARLLSQTQYKVFGTSRNPASAEIILDVEMLSLDVRKDDSVRACVETVCSRGGRLDVLINNAGHELAGALEELSAIRRGCATRLGSKRSPSPVCGDFSLRGCTNRGCGVPSRWTELSETQFLGNRPGGPWSAYLGVRQWTGHGNP